MNNSIKFKTILKINYTTFNTSGISNQLNGLRILLGLNQMRNKSLNHSTFSFSAKEAFPIYIWTQNLIQTVIGLKEKMEYYNSFKILMTINLLKIKSILKSQICNWKTFQIIIKAKKRFKTILKLQLNCLKICKIKMMIRKQKELSLDKFIKCKYAIKKLSK